MSILTLLLAIGSSQAFETGPVPFDISEIKASLQIVTDGKQHYIAYSTKDVTSSPALYGDGKTFYRQRSIGGSASGTESFGRGLWDPRVPVKYRRPEFFMKESGKEFGIDCGAKTTALSPLSEADTKKMIDSAAFKGPLWTRRPLRLLRDDTGVYYLIDVLRTDDEENRDHRVFVGVRGKMKLVPLKSVVDDSEGMILATKDGQLRLVAANHNSGRQEGTSTGYKWVSGKTELQLVDVPLSNPSNGRMVYSDLGVYDEQRLGTPCDDLN